MNDPNKTTFLGIFSRNAIPKGAKPIKNFELEKYLGTWYDIAHIAFKNEKENASNVYVQYTAQGNELVEVKNNAYLEDKQEWYSRIGKAKFRGETNVGALAVSFDNIKWAGYNVISIDKDYTCALVFGRNLDLMWMLSRTKKLPEYIKKNYLKIAEKTGYDTSKLIFTIHNRDDN